MIHMHQVNSESWKALLREAANIPGTACRPLTKPSRDQHGCMTWCTAQQQGYYLISS